MPEKFKALQRQRDESILIARKYYHSDRRPDPDHFEKRDCPACSSGSATFAYRNDSFNTFVKCNNCDMVYMDPILKKDLVHELYTESGDRTAKHRLWSKSVKDLKPLPAPCNSERFDLLLKYSGGGRFLDFGCGFGKLTDQLKFYFDEIEGVEIDSYCAKHAEEIFGFRVHNDFIENLNLKDRYDTCMSYNNIEHLIDPEKVLNYIHTSLKDKGLLYIECPNIESLSIRIFKGKHHLLQSMEHVNMFSHGTLSQLMKKCGFEPLEGRTRKLDILSNDLITFLLKRDRFYHRCCSPFADNGIYGKAVKLIDNILQRTFSVSNNRLFKQGSYIQMVARKI